NLVWIGAQPLPPLPRVHIPNLQIAVHARGGHQASFRQEVDPHEGVTVGTGRFNDASIFQAEHHHFAVVPAGDQSLSVRRDVAGADPESEWKSKEPHRLERCGFMNENTQWPALLQRRERTNAMDS